MNASNLINLADQPGFSEMAIDFLMKTNERLTQELKTSVEDHDGDYKILASYRDVMGEIEELEEQDYFEGSTIDGLVDYVKDLKGSKEKLCQWVKKEVEESTALKKKVSELEEKLKLELKISSNQKWLLDQKENMANELLSANVEVALWENTLANYGDTPAEVNDSIGELECEKDTLEERKDELEAEVSDWENTLTQWGETPDEVFSCVMTELKIKVAGAIDLLQPTPTH